MSAEFTDVHQVAPHSRIAEAAGSARAAIRSDSIPAQILRFTLHVVEMAIAMVIGMMPLGFVLNALGQSDLSSRSPEAYSLAMNLSMVVPMAGWMLIRRHGVRLTVEMAAAMIVPGGLLAVASLAGILPHAAALSGSGILMWAGMLAAMAFRWPAYARHCHARTSSAH
jgi:hypothetical protein